MRATRASNKLRINEFKAGEGSIGGATSIDFKGFYTPWQIPLLTLVAVALIIFATGWLAISRVLKTEPAAVFR